MSTSSTPKQASRGRGRSRFVATQDYLENVESNGDSRVSSEVPSRRATSTLPRKRPSESIATRPNQRTTEPPRKASYAVEELVNESPLEYFKKPTKSKVLTESSFETTSKPSRRSSLVETQPVTAASEVSKSTEDLGSNSIIQENSVSLDSSITESLEEQPIDTTLKTNTLDLPGDAARETLNEVPKTTPQVTTSKPIEAQRIHNGANRRNNLRSRASENVVTSKTPETTRTRVRTRAPKKLEVATVSNSAPPRNIDRTTRRKSVPPTPPPVLFTPEVIRTESRFTPEKRAEPAEGKQKSSLDLITSRSRDVRRRTAAPSAVTTAKTVDQPTRRTNFRTRVGNPPPIQTFSSRNSLRARDVPPVIDEQKLEVLPLFASEPKTVRPVTRSRTRERTSRHSEPTTNPPSRTTRSRSRSRNTLIPEDTLLTSATENDLKFTKPNETPAIVSVSVNVETRTESSFKRKQSFKRPQVKESVVSEVSEVTSKRTVPRRRNKQENSVLQKTKLQIEKNKLSGKVPGARGNRKSEVKLAQIKKSKGDGSDEIDESDNYPAPFKALIQAKKNKVSVFPIESVA